MIRKDHVNIAPFAQPYTLSEDERYTMHDGDVYILWMCVHTHE